MTAKRGRPCKEPTVPVSIRMPEGLAAYLQDLAEKEDRALSYVVVRALKEWRESKDK